MNKSVLKLLRILLILFSLVLGFLASLAFVWISEKDSEYSYYYLDGVKFNNEEHKLTFTDAMNKACSFSEAYKINNKDAMENDSFSKFFSGREAMIDPISYCESITGLKTPSIITESILIIIQILIFVISALSNTKVIQEAPDAVTLIKR